MASTTAITALTSLCSTNPSAPGLLAALSGNTSTAVIKAVSVHHHGSLVPVKSPALALVAVAHLGIMLRHHPVIAHPVLQAHRAVSIVIITGGGVSPDALHVLEQQLSQQLRRVNYGLARRTVGRV